MNRVQPHSREDKVFYFSTDTAPDCWVGALHDEDQMPENEIAEYIKFSRPDIFERLQGLPLGSGDIALSTEYEPLSSGLDYSPAAEGRPVGLSLALVDTDIMRAATVDIPGQPRRKEKRSSERDADSSKSRKRPLKSLDAGRRCESGSCLNRHEAEDGGRLLVGAELDVASGENLCHSCSSKNGVIERENEPQDAAKAVHEHLLLDGVDSSTVLATASRLFPQVNIQNYNSNHVSSRKKLADHAHHYPSNSHEAREIRARTETDTQACLAEVSKYEKARDVEMKRWSSSPKVTVNITRPYYMEPWPDRYKKQGLTQPNQSRHVRSKHGGLSTPIAGEMLPQLSFATPIKILYDKTVICICQEPEGSGEILRCSAEFCPVGWFHFCCTDLKDMPTTEDEFLCRYCSGGIDRSTVRKLPDGYPHTDIMSATNSPSADDLRSLQLLQSDNELRVLSDVASLVDIEDSQDEFSTPSTSSTAQFELLRQKVSRWAAVNTSTDDIGYLARLSEPSTDLRDSSDISAASRRSERKGETTFGTETLGDELIIACDSDAPTTISIASRSNNSTFLATAYNSPRQHNLICAIPTLTHGTGHVTIGTPLTPPQTPTYISSKPWGTPVNISTSGPSQLAGSTSPSIPASSIQRNFDQMEQGKQGLYLEVADSDDECGELVPLILGY